MEDIRRYIDNSLFIKWVYDPDEHIYEYWDFYLDKHPDEKEFLIELKSELALFRISGQTLSEEKKKMLSEKIVRKILDRQRITRVSEIGKFFLKYAAILIITLSIGVAGFWGFYQIQKSYVYSTVAYSGKNSKSQLHLSNGTIVDIEKDNSKITLGGDQKITIDDKKVIDLNKTSLSDESKMNEVDVPFGKKSQLTLEDGTKVWLNAGSRMAFPTKFKGKKREVFLEGEGYFEVAHNPKLPFYVNTNDIVIKVLGTRFNISAYGSDKLIETVLIEGRVAISELSTLSFMKKESILVPNQKASYDRNEGSMVVSDEPNVEYTIAWTKGWFKFQQQSITDVLNKLQRYYNVKFVLSPGFPKGDLITGKLDLKDSIDQIMRALDIIVILQYRIDGNQIYIGKKNNELQKRK